MSFIDDIREAVNNGNLREPFRAKDVKEAVKGYAEGTYPTYLPKHRKGNPSGNKEYFEQLSRGLYRLS